MKKILLFLILISTVSYAISVTPAKAVYDNTPAGTEIDYSVNFFGSSNPDGAIEYEVRWRTRIGGVDTELEDDLLNQIKLPPTGRASDWNDQSTSQTISFIMPDFNLPGTREIQVIGTDVTDPSAGMVAKAAIAHLIRIIKSPEGQYADLIIGVKDYAADEEVFSNFTIESLGTEDLSSGTLQFDLISGESTLQSISYDTSMGLVYEHSFGVLDPGMYRVNAQFTNGIVDISGSENFVVADNNFHYFCNDVTGYPGENKFVITVQSGFLDSQSVGLQLFVDGSLVDENYPLMSPLEERSINFGANLLGTERTFDFIVDGETVCTGQIEFKEENSGLPAYVYYVGGGVVLLVILCSVFYFVFVAKNDEEEQMDF